MRMTQMLCGLFMLVSVLAACGEGEKGVQRTVERVQLYCENINVNGRARFILQCIQSAKPAGQSSPESWIGDCKAIAESTLCPLIPVRVVETCTEVSVTGSCAVWDLVSYAPVNPLPLMLDQPPPETAPEPEARKGSFL